MGYYIVLSGVMLFAAIVVFIAVHQDRKEKQQSVK